MVNGGMSPYITAAGGSNDHTIVYLSEQKLILCSNFHALDIHNILSVTDHPC
jgi:hypothetical protein